MAFYTGRSADGSDMREHRGMFVSPDGEEWSNMPFTQEQANAEKMHKKEDRAFTKIFDHINGKRTLREEFYLVLYKKSTLSKSLRDFVNNYFTGGQVMENEYWLERDIIEYIGKNRGKDSVDIACFFPTAGTENVMDALYRLRMNGTIERKQYGLNSEYVISLEHKQSHDED